LKNAEVTVQGKTIKTNDISPVQQKNSSMYKSFLGAAALLAW
jgi:hypothetical protein